MEFLLIATVEVCDTVKFSDFTKKKRLKITRTQLFPLLNHHFFFLRFSFFLEGQRDKQIVIHSWHHLPTPRTLSLPQSSPATPRAYCSPANPKGKGLSSSRHETQTTGLSSRLQETHFLLRRATNGSGTLAQAPGNPPRPPRQKPPISLAPPSTWHWQQTGRHHPRSLETLVSRGKFHQKEKSHWGHTPEFSLGLLGFSCSTPRPSASPTASATIPSLLLTRPCLSQSTAFL